MSKEEVKQTFEEWLTARELAPRLKMSPSTVYSLVRRGSDIPCAVVSKGKILFNWASVNHWLHDLEAKRRRRSFES